MKLQRVLLAISLLAVAGLIFMACQSQELTSAKLYIQQQNWDKAEEFLKKAEQVEPQNPEIPFLLGTEIYQRQNKYEKMNAAFDRSLKISDQFKDKIHNIRLKAWTDEFNAGAKKYNAALNDTGSTRTQLLQQAISHFVTATKIMPSKPETYNSLATAYLLTDENDKAKATFEKSLEMNPDNFQVLFNYGKLEANLGNYDKSIDLLEKAHKLKSDNSSVIQLLAKLYIDTKNAPKALEMYSAAIQQQPDNPDLYFNEAILHIQMAKKYVAAEKQDSADVQFEDAIQMMKKAVDLNPGDIEAETRLGELYQELEKWDEAADVFRSILDKDPKNTTVLRKLAITVYRQGNPQEGQKLLEKAKKIEAEGSDGN